MEEEQRLLSLLAGNIACIYTYKRSGTYLFKNIRGARSCNDWNRYTSKKTIHSTTVIGEITLPNTFFVYLGHIFAELIAGNKTTHGETEVQTEAFFCHRFTSKQ